MPVSAKLTSDQDQKQAAAAAAAGRNTAKSEQVVDDDFHNMEPASGLIHHWKNSQHIS